MQNSNSNAGTKVPTSTTADATMPSQTIAKPNVIRRIYMEMIHERDHVENDPKYTVSYREGYNEAVRCLGVIIKQLTTEDVRQDGV